MKTYTDLLALAADAPIIEPPSTDSPPSGGDDHFQHSGYPSSATLADPSPNHSPNVPLLEADDDPHRLARVNLTRYRIATNGGTIRYWRGEFYTWKPDRGCYRIIDDEELRSKVSSTVKTEFDRISADKIESSRNSDSEDNRPQRVTKALTTNVIEATKSITIIPSSTELGTWIDGDSGNRRRRQYIAMANGILDLDRLLQNNDDDDIDDVLLPPTPEWFSTVRLPYNFDPTATCPRFESFLERSLELDPERIKILQEWAGNLLSPDTSIQKFLALEGEGSNGKSVYFASVTAMIGLENCSYCSIEQLSDKFARTQSLGKLANLCPDVSEKSDKVNEGDLKSFSSGDVMFFDRKHKTGMNCVPTARLMVSWNNRPRWADRSNGIWRRLLLVPFRVQIQDNERVLGMDKHEWWIETGELPGMLNWAISGLVRLRQQQRFTRSTLGDEAVEDYRNEANPARSFLMEFVEPADDHFQIPTSFLYKLYRKWAEENGYRPLGDRIFGKEVKRAFPLSDRKKRGPRENRHWSYSAIKFSQDEVCGEKTYGGDLFQ